MSVLVLIVALAVGGDGERDSPSAQPAPQTEPRGFREIQNAMRDVFRTHATATTRDDRWVATLQMVAIYDEVVSHPKYESSDTLRSYRNQLWSRLTRAKKQIAREVAELGGAQPMAEKAREPGATLETALETGSAASDQDTSYQGTSFSQSAADNDSGVLGDGSRGGGFGPADEGQALIELIQRTITPDHWDVLGGPGTIVYYAPLKALVVRANAQVHGRVGGILGGLRAAGP